MDFLFGNVRANLAAMKASNEQLEKRLDFWMKEAHGLQARLDETLDRLEATEALVETQTCAKRKRACLRSRTSDHTGPA